jgi:hydroxylamine reductase
VEFAAFPGAIIMTSNCLIEPQDSYKDRIFTAGPVGWPGVPHLEHGDFTLAIEAAKAAVGFTEDEEEKSVMVGFGRHTVLSVADKVVEAVKSGDISHFFVVGGCDGAAPGRNYYTELVEQTPDDTVVLTLGCGKYRFNDQDLGDIGGIPRLLDVGQCNDTYSAIQIALALAKEFDCGVNDLPLSYMVSWFEQKAVAVLLSLLSLGIKGIHLGPTLPGFITPNLLNILVETFDIKPNGVASEDLAKALAQQAA